MQDGITHLILRVENPARPGLDGSKRPSIDFAADTPAIEDDTVFVIAEVNNATTARDFGPGFSTS